MRRLNAVRLQRERALARRRLNKWLTEPVEPPSQEVLDFAEWRMGIVDNMPPRWRALVYYFGTRAIEMYEGGTDLNTAYGQLESLKARRQGELLNANYFPKTNRGKPP